MVVNKITDFERDTLSEMLANNEAENLLLATPLVDYLAAPEDQEMLVQSVANDIMKQIVSYQVDPTTLTSGVALALFSLASSLYEGYPDGNMIN